MFSGMSLNIEEMCKKCISQGVRSDYASPSFSFWLKTTFSSIYCFFNLTTIPSLTAVFSFSCFSRKKLVKPTN